MRHVAHDEERDDSVKAARGPQPEHLAHSDAREVADRLEAIQRTLRQRLAAAAQRYPVALTGPQVLALERLVESMRATGTGLSLSELSGQMGLAHSTVSGIVTRLERRGLVRRMPQPDDRRFVSIELTQPVMDWLSNELPAARMQPREAAMRSATRRERAVVLEGLAALERLLEGDARERDADDAAAAPARADRDAASG